MADLADFVADLVRQAKAETDPRQLRGAVERVLDGFDRAGEATRTSAVRTIGAALRTTSGRGAQVLCLALGALVEAGASPDLAYASLARDLPELLQRATAFATATLRHAKVEEVEAAIEASGAEVARKRPADAAAWNAVPARALAAVACLVRSKALRRKERKREALLAAAWPLSDVVAEASDLVQALRIFDDARILVLAPGLGRGFVFEVDQVPSNAELYILLADALASDPKKPRVAGRAPDAKAVAAIKEGAHPKKPLSVGVGFHLLAWTALQPDGTLASADPDAAEHFLWIDALPADIPRLGDQCVIFLEEVAAGPKIPVIPPFEGLRSSVRLARELTSAEVLQAMLQVTQAAAANAPPPATSAKKAAKRAATSAKSATKPSPKTSGKAKASATKTKPRPKTKPPRSRK